nr:MAG TPA: hypothetical protein [Caudoviricetes sp.]
MSQRFLSARVFLGRLGLIIVFTAFHVPFQPAFLGIL